MEAFLNLIIILLLVFMNGFFVAAEFAMVRVRKSRIETLSSEGNLLAKYAEKVVNDLNSYLSTCQLGVTLASLGLGWVGEPAVAKMIEPLIKNFNLSQGTIHTIAFGLGFAIITAFHIVLGELVPKSMSIINAEKLSLYTALPLMMFNSITYPVIWLFNHSTNLILRLFGISQMDEHEAAHTDDEIMQIVEESYKHGLIDKTELAFMDNIFDFSEKSVREIMVPRTDMVCLYKDYTFEKIVEIAMEEELTRYPVCVKNKDDVIGFVHIKDLFKLELLGKDRNIDEIIRSVIFVPETISISVLFKKFQKEKSQMAIVVDEYGGTSGLVTSEDILEEIVGEIQDEFDDEFEQIIKLDNDTYSIDGKVLVEDINEILEINIEVEEVDTIGGWVYSMLGATPQVNQSIEYEEYIFTVTKSIGQRILRITVKKIRQE
jgi:CBS domain containing-hemolysin-like protein